LEQPASILALTEAVETLLPNSVSTDSLDAPKARSRSTEDVEKHLNHVFSDMSFTSKWFNKFPNNATLVTYLRGKFPFIDKDISNSKILRFALSKREKIAQAALEAAPFHKKPSVILSNVTKSTLASSYLSSTSKRAIFEDTIDALRTGKSIPPKFIDMLENLPNMMRPNTNGLAEA
jgi:hypothetical protein